MDPCTAYRYRSGANNGWNKREQKSILSSQTMFYFSTNLQTCKLRYGNKYPWSVGKSIEVYKCVAFTQYNRKKSKIKFCHFLHYHNSLWPVNMYFSLSATILPGIGWTPLRINYCFIFNLDACLSLHSHAKHLHLE